MAELRITQIKSGASGKGYQRTMLRALGLKRIGQTVVRKDRPEAFGMIRIVAHPVEAGEVR